jgi:formate hydrogenlyase subunit 3/multisubunit Na+/H+ antiporter MnhD subunit
MFLAAGLIAKALGHDRIADFRGVGRALPMSVFAFALGGLSLMGMPPSGGFVAKWLLLRAAIESSQWWWAIVIVTGGLFTGSYVFHVVARALGASGGTPALRCAIPRHQEALVLGLALLWVAMGLLPIASLGLVLIGRPS